MKTKNQIFKFPMASFIILIMGSLIIISCNNEPKSKSKTNMKTTINSNIKHPEWSKNAVIYEVNVRQFSPEGTLKAFEKHLPRLKELGVDILWFMPIYPIGEKNRKGGMGSYYSVRDYTAVNPEFGTLDDFKDVVKKAHDLGMYVILDWVANHCAWDNPWVESHPDWFTKDENGDMVSPYDWSDVVDLNYDNPEMRDAMTEALRYWVRDVDVDGYRCDVAGMVPVDFWNNARVELDKIKPVFMLAESEDPIHHEQSFDMTYTWDLHHLMNDIAAGKKNAKDIDKYFKKQDTLFPADAYRMYFITNHDENSWNGTEYERMGDAANTFAVLTYTLLGMPLIYSGQEAAFNERLRFFEKDTIDWGNYSLTDFYQKLGQLRKENPALWSGEEGGTMKRIKTSDDEAIYAFMRKKDKDAVVVLANLTDQPKEFTIKVGQGKAKEATDWFSGDVFVLEADLMIKLSPWGYKVLVLNNE